MLFVFVVVLMLLFRFKSVVMVFLWVVRFCRVKGEDLWCVFKLVMMLGVLFMVCFIKVMCLEVLFRNLKVIWILWDLLDGLFRCMLVKSLVVISCVCWLKFVLLVWLNWVDI